MYSAKTKYLDKTTKEKSRSARMFRVPAAANCGKLAAEKQSGASADHSFFFSVCVCVARTRVRECVHSLGKKSKAAPFRFRSWRAVVWWQEKV
jgi:hypothetical protein